MAKFIKLTSGAMTEELAVTTSTGIAQADKVPATNASGFIDPTLINGKNTSAGAADAAKVPILDASGRLDSTFLPVGIGADTASIMTSEPIAAGNLVNIWDDAGTAKVRLADNATSGKAAMGFCLAAFGSGVAATVYFEGTNTGMGGLTPGVAFLGSSGGVTATAPTGAGKLVQIVGFSTTATSMNFNAAPGVVLAS